MGSRQYFKGLSGQAQGSRWAKRFIRNRANRFEGEQFNLDRSWRKRRISITITKSKSMVIFKPLPSDDPELRCPDIKIAKKVLNWEPEVSLKDGLKKTIEYFREKIEG